MIVLFKTNLEKNNKYKILRNFSDKNRKTLYRIYISKQRFRSKKIYKGAKSILQSDLGQLGIRKGEEVKDQFSENEIKKMKKRLIDFQKRMDA